MNGDGIPDLVYASGGYPYTLFFGLTVMLGNGDGTFNVVSAYGMGIESEPVYVAFGDFNGDGVPDMAVTDVNNSAVNIFIGIGDGTFSGPTPVTVGAAPQTITVADFRGNGMLDLAVANGGSNSISILLGNGDGTFTAGQTVQISASTDSTAVGDFNGDGIADIAVGTGSGNSVTILQGKGDGTFTSMNVLETTQMAGILSSADLNGDGVPDLTSPGVVLLTQSAIQQLQHRPILRSRALEHIWLRPVIPETPTSSLAFQAQPISSRSLQPFFLPLFFAEPISVTPLPSDGRQAAALARICLPPELRGRVQMTYMTRDRRPQPGPM